MAPEALEEVAAQYERDREIAERAVRETRETHVLRTARCGTSPARWGPSRRRSRSTTTRCGPRPCRWAGCDGAGACVSLRDRLENEPLLADGVKAIVADAGVELLQGQVRHALAAEEAALQQSRTPTVAFPWELRPRLSPRPHPQGRMARARVSASELQDHRTAVARVADARVVLRRKRKSKTATGACVRG